MFKSIIFTALGITLTITSSSIYAESQEELESKCAVVITSRINDNQDPYQYALDRIRMCKKNDILSVSSFLDTLTTKVYFNGRKNLIERCVNNLVDNAIKYASKVHIELSKSNGNLFIKIEDNGPGIPINEYDNVFKPFYYILNINFVDW